MAYRKVYFRIHTEGYVSGWSSDSDKAAFKEESRPPVQIIGLDDHPGPQRWL